MKNSFFTLMLILHSYLMCSQNDSLPLNKNLFKVNLLSSGVTFERDISSNSTINFDFNLSYGLTSRNGSELNILVSPFLRGQYRYYYNLKKRELKGKSVLKNSGSFISFNTSYYFLPINDEKHLHYLDGLTVGGVWGFQKTYKSNINISANTGLGYNLSENNEKKIVPIINVTFGYVIGK